MRHERRTKLVFLLPAVVWVLCFTIFPLLYGLRLSLYNVKMGAADEFVGLANFRHFFADERALNSLAVTLIFVVCGVTVQLVLGIALALLFNRALPMRGLLRTLVTAPLFATPIAVGFLFVTIFYEEGGLINGLLGLKVPWLSHPHWALASVILVDIWQWTPFCFLIFLAALQGIPADYYEAAALETRRGWTVFRHITFPVLKPTIVLVLLLRITEAFKVFDIPFTLTTGGPGTATQVLSMYAYRVGMRFFNFGYSSSISIILFLLVTGIILVLFKRIRQAYQ
ncbi:MAG TPA: sugar ABC transporter permease [Planctomycetota bacterium]|nr:sugar ABC transporter permease [Planctomycetota bacterium]